MSRHSRGFKRVAKTNQWHAERFVMSLQREINRLKQLIKAAAERADAVGLAYDEFDALVDEVKSWADLEQLRSTIATNGDTSAHEESNDRTNDKNEADLEK